MIGEQRYLLDNNALSQVPQADRRGAFVRSLCRMPEEVIHEAQGYPDIDAFSDLTYPTTLGVLQALQEVMASVDPADSKLVDLFHNRGNADPLLIACAIDARTENAQYLLADEWVVVTDDHAVQAKARAFHVATVSSVEFLIELRSRSTRRS